MTRVAALAFLLFVAGCAHTSVQVNSGGGATPSSARASVGVSGGGRSVAWLLIGIGLIAAGEYAGRQHADGAAAPVPPGELDQARRVNEQDCTQPIKDWSANLKCR